MKTKKDSSNMLALKRRIVQEQIVSPSSLEHDSINIAAIYRGVKQPTADHLTHLQGHQQPNKIPRATTENHPSNKEININIIIRAAPKQTSKCMLL